MTPVKTQDAIRAAGNSLINKDADRTPTDKLGKDDFIKLMMTQMTNQDPLSPMDSKGMMEQFAQMGTMEQLQNLNKQIEGMHKTEADISRSTAFSYLERDVTVNGGVTRLTSGIGQPIHFNLPQEAGVMVFVTDTEGNSVKTLDLGSMDAGRITIPWDGKDNEGHRVMDGDYRYNVVAKTANDLRIPVELQMTGKVSGVRFNNGRPMLQMNGSEVDANQVISVSNESEKTFGGLAPKPLIEELRPKPPAADEGAR
ncbi:MAG: flagellar hook assembly protein FlgD [Deltaproteobacteria bacterium]|nr:flagellar hook assembly protein FlgD [Deltaproteobacteria bacterium]